MKSNQKIPFLMYHAILGHGRMGEQADPVYTIPVEEFDKQLAYLRRAGFETISVAQYLKWLRNARGGSKSDRSLPERPVVLTFDDGDPSHMDMVLPRLTQYRFQAAFAIVADWIGRPESMSGEELRLLSSAGMEILSHGMSHAPLSELSLPQLYRELRDSRLRLEGLLQKPVRFLSIPRGFCSVRISQAAYESGYRAILTSRPDRNGRDADPYSLGRIPIKGHHSIQEFIGMVEGQLLPQLRQLGGYLVRRGAQRMLGVKRYDRLRRSLLDEQSQETGPPLVDKRS